jgi:hypothetical protein
MFSLDFSVWYSIPGHQLDVEDHGVVLGSDLLLISLKPIWCMIRSYQMLCESQSGSCRP